MLFGRKKKPAAALKYAIDEIAARDPVVADYDVVYYWTGDERHGQWNEAIATDDLDAQVLRMKRQGFWAVKARRARGAPSAPPAVIDRNTIKATVAA